MLAVEVQLLSRHLQIVLRLVCASAQMIGSDHLLSTTLAFRVFVRERCLHEIVAGVTISVAVTLKPAVEGLISLFLFMKRGLFLEFLESRLRSLIDWIVRFS